MPKSRPCSERDNDANRLENQGGNIPERLSMRLHYTLVVAEREEVSDGSSFSTLGCLAR